MLVNEEEGEDDEEEKDKYEKKWWEGKRNVKEKMTKRKNI